MYLKSASSYVSGLTKMASYNMIPSYMDADCMELDNYLESFAKVYKIPIESIKLEEIDANFEELFTELFNADKKALDSFFHWIRMEAGNCKKIYTAENEEFFKGMSGEYGGNGPFFFLETVYFIEFDKMAICFMIGNDE